jgi:hypothetical protein
LRGSFLPTNTWQTAASGVFCPPLGIALGIGYGIYNASSVSTTFNTWMNNK